jgi:hypothetical protein
VSYDRGEIHIAVAFPVDASRSAVGDVLTDLEQEITDHGGPTGES